MKSAKPLLAVLASPLLAEDRPATFLAEAGKLALADAKFSSGKK